MRPTEEIQADALRWYRNMREGDPRIPHEDTPEGKIRLAYAFIMQESIDPDYNDEDGSKFFGRLQSIRPIGSSGFDFINGWRFDDKEPDEEPLWAKHWEYAYDEVTEDLQKLLKEGHKERAEKVRALADAIEEAFPIMVNHLRTRRRTFP